MCVKEITLSSEIVDHSVLFLFPNSYSGVSNGLWCDVNGFSRTGTLSSVRLNSGKLNHFHLLNEWMCFLVGFGGAEGIGISRLYTKPADKMDPTANCHEDKQKTERL